MTVMRNNAPQKGTTIAHRHGFDPGASQLQGHCFATEP